MNIKRLALPVAALAITFPEATNVGMHSTDLKTGTYIVDASSSVLQPAEDDLRYRLDLPDESSPGDVTEVLDGDPIAASPEGLKEELRKGVAGGLGVLALTSTVSIIFRRRTK
jgi:hypothetical protein